MIEKLPTQNLLDSETVGLMKGLKDVLGGEESGLPNYPNPKTNKQKLIPSEKPIKNNELKNIDDTLNDGFFQTIEPGKNNEINFVGWNGDLNTINNITKEVGENGGYFFSVKQLLDKSLFFPANQFTKISEDTMRREDGLTIQFYDSKNKLKEYKKNAIVDGTISINNTKFLVFYDYSN